MPGQCCVFQIFDDGGASDKRYDEVILPAIKAPDLEPCRVDRDAGAEIHIDTLHEEIRRSAVCLADITPDDPNVWYELGFAVASDQPIVMICKKGRTLPFDTHHRSTIFYTQESQRDSDGRYTPIYFSNLRTQYLGLSHVHTHGKHQPMARSGCLFDLLSTQSDSPEGAQRARSIEDPSHRTHARLPH